MIRVLIADDHSVVAEGLKQLIEEQPDIQVLGLVQDGRDAVRRAHDLEPDVVLMDLSMPELNGFDATRAIFERHAKCRIIVLSIHADPDYVRRAFKAGAWGYVGKLCAGTELLEAIRTVHSGQRYVGAGLTDPISDILAGQHEDHLLARLSVREREVIQLLAEGRTHAEIAQRLSLSPKTVETYRARVVTKLGIRDLAGLVRFAIQRGLVSLD